MNDDARPFCSGEEIAAMLDCSRSYFYKHRDFLHELGMPQPLPRFRPARYPRALVVRWIHQLANHEMPPPPSRKPPREPASPGISLPKRK